MLPIRELAHQLSMVRRHGERIGAATRRSERSDRRPRVRGQRARIEHRSRAGRCAVAPEATKAAGAPSLPRERKAVPG